MLHNFLIDETRGRYNPMMMANNVENSIEALIDILPDEMRGRNARNSRDDAKRMQQRLSEYFNGVGAVPWQDSQI